MTALGYADLVARVTETMKEWKLLCEASPVAGENPPPTAEGLPKDSPLRRVVVARQGFSSAMSGAKKGGMLDFLDLFFSHFPISSLLDPSRRRKSVLQVRVAGLPILRWSRSSKHFLNKRY